MASLNRKYKASGVDGFLKNKTKYQHGMPLSEQEKLITFEPQQTESFSEIKIAHKQMDIPPDNLNLSEVPLEVTGDCGIDKVVGSTDNHVVQKDKNIEEKIPIVTPMKKIHESTGDAREEFQKKIVEEKEKDAKQTAKELQGSGLSEQEQPKRPLKLGISMFEEQLKTVPEHPAVDEPIPSSSTSSNNVDKSDDKEKPDWLQKLWAI